MFLNWSEVLFFWSWSSFTEWSCSVFLFHLEFIFRKQKTKSKSKLKKDVVNLQLFCFYEVSFIINLFTKKSCFIYSLPFLWLLLYALCLKETLKVVFNEVLQGEGAALGISGFPMCFLWQIMQELLFNNLLKYCKRTKRTLSKKISK